MIKNEGTIDRTMRILLGLGLLSLVFLEPQSLWGYIGLIPLATGLVGVCPLYLLVGMNTCPAKK